MSETARAVRIGVTGHRAYTHGDTVAHAVDRILDTLDGTRPGTVVSSIAEGADRLVAWRALARPGWTLTVVLPLDPDDYLTDFADDASRTEFAELLERAGEVEQVAVPVSAMPGTASSIETSRLDGYAAAGHRVVDRTDALIALWDGEPAAGRGGTAEIVAYARSLDRPLAWIRVPNLAGEPNRSDTGSTGALGGEAPDVPDPIDVAPEITWERWRWPG